MHSLGAAVKPHLTCMSILRTYLYGIKILKRNRVYVFYVFQID